MDPIVVYHGGCPDGAMAAAVAYRYFSGKVALVPAAYHKPVEEFVTPELAHGRHIYIVDFSFSVEETERLGEWVGEGCRVVVLDHHKSALERFGPWLPPGAPPANINVEIDMGYSGAMLAWRWFFGSKDAAPRIVEYVEDYDLWRHKMPSSKAVHAYLRSLDMDVEEYAKLLDYGPDNSATDEEVIALKIAEGRAILRANDQQARVLADKPETVTFDGLTALAVNAPLHQDDVGDMLAHAEDNASGVGIMWYWRDGKYKVSLRSRSVDGREPLDVSKVAALYGGGGHRSAASFKCDELPWRKR